MKHRAHTQPSRLILGARGILTSLAPLFLVACAHTATPASESPALQVAPAAASASVVAEPQATQVTPAPAPSVAPTLAITVSDVKYRAGKTELSGYLAVPQKAGPAPAVLVVHEWWGQNDYAQRRARMFAELGYVALAVDMYGSGKTTTDPKVAAQLSKAAFSDAAALKQKFEAARELLAGDPRVDNKKIAAVGYCFGGGVVLNMIRRGVPLDVAASFHGTLKTEQPLKKGTFAGTVLIEAGDADPMVPLTDVEAIRGELTKAGAPFQIDVYPGATHAFTNPAATDIGKQYNLPIAYDPAADAKSWQTLKDLLNQVWTK